MLNIVGSIMQFEGKEIMKNGLFLGHINVQQIHLILNKEYAKIR